MSYLVDANVLSEPTRPDPDPSVVAWLRAREGSLIAATALAHGLTLVTRNRRDFEAAGISLLDPFDS